MIKKYNKFINESIRDKMVGVPFSEIEDNLSKLDLPSKLVFIKKHKLDDDFLPSDEEIKSYYNNKLDKAVVLFKEEYKSLNNLSFEYTQYHNEYEDYAESSLLTKEQVKKLGYEFDNKEEQYIEVSINKPYANLIKFFYAERNNSSKMTQYITRYSV